MNYKLLAGISLVVFMFLMAAPTTSTGTGTAVPSYSFDLSITPDQQQSGVFQARLVIRELAANAVIAEPTIRFRAGEQANAVSGDGADNTHFQFSVGVNKTGVAAEYNASVFQGSTVVSGSQGKISLKE